MHLKPPCSETADGLKPLVPSRCSRVYFCCSWGQLAMSAWKKIAVYFSGCALNLVMPAPPHAYTQGGWGGAWCVQRGGGGWWAEAWCTKVVVG
eukprot:scaffold45568_cov60-Phaeocystis_antarctica.AAC.1